MSCGARMSRQLKDRRRNADVGSLELVLCQSSSCCSITSISFKGEKALLQQIIEFMCVGPWELLSLYPGLSLYCISNIYCSNPLLDHWRKVTDFEPACLPAVLNWWTRFVRTRLLLHTECDIWRSIFNKKKCSVCRCPSRVSQETLYQPCCSLAANPEPFLTCTGPNSGADTHHWPARIHRTVHRHAQLRQVPRPRELILLLTLLLQLTMRTRSACVLGECAFIYPIRLSFPCASTLASHDNELVL